MEQNTYISKKDIILLLSYGIFGASGFARVIMQKYLGVPYMPEVFMIPLLFLLREHFVGIKIKFNKLLVAAIVWGIFWVISELDAGSGTIFTHSRAFLYMFLLYAIFSDRDNTIGPSFIMYICLGSFIGWVFSFIYNVLHPDVYLEARGSGYTYGNLMAIPLFLYTAFHREKRGVFYLGLILILFILFTSGLRRVMIVSAMSIVFVLFTSNTMSFKSFIKILFGLSIISILVAINWERIGSAVYEASPATYYRVFERPLESFTGESNSDEERTGNIESFVDWQYGHVLPSGYLRTYGSGEFGMYNDLPLFMLCHTFGMIIMYLLLAVIFTQWIHAIMKYQHNKSEYIQCFLVSELILFMLLFLEGGFLTDPVVIQFSALSIGSISRINKIYR